MTPQTIQREESADTFNTLRLPVQIIRRDGDTQGRISLNSEVVEEYAALLREGVAFPAVRVWFDDTNYWLADGHQRVAAAKLAGIKEVVATVFHGTLTDAQWDSYSANSEHGLRRTRADLRVILERAFRHEKGWRMSNYELSRHLGIPETTVRRWRKSMLAPNGVDEKRVVVRSGQKYILQTSHIGKVRSPSRRKSIRDIQRDLAAMRYDASPDCRRLLAVIVKWTRCNAAQSDCLRALEALILEWKVSVSE
ncbi:MAG TPA: ParB/Srx family N-terminal domain-containing protein [Bryobacteraceae bacterium]|jgi:hypothetical protein|nr:ParB/Srx family N-terminal domain-containing protein [Bryobacteraceae bacterium]